MTTKLYLDTRATAPGAPAPMKIAINHHGQTALHGIGIRISPDQWDAKTGKVIRHPQKQLLNTILTSRKSEWDMTLLMLRETGEAKGKTARELKMLALEKIDPDAGP